MKSDERLYSNASSLFDHLKTEGFSVFAPVDVDAIAGLLGIVIENDLSLEDKGTIGEILFRDQQPVVKINPIQNS